jgi:hypothetical protein
MVAKAGIHVASILVVPGLPRAPIEITLHTACAEDEEVTMSKFATNLISGCGVLTGLLCVGAAIWPAVGAETALPDFSPSSKVGWIAYGTEFMPPPSGPGPVMDDPAHPRVSNAAAAATGRQPTFHISNPDNPILQSWARDALKKRNALILAGMPGYTRQVSCWPMGVPAFLLYPVQPIYIIQTSKEVFLISQQDHMVRHIHMNVPHSENPKPSWYGESVGHYEADTLVVDTIGMNDQTYVDNYRTPHTDRLHVIERFHMIEGGKTLEVNIHVEDPGAFTTPWNAVQRYRRTEQGPIVEAFCAENNVNYFNHDVEPIPQADKPDF